MDDSAVIRNQINKYQILVVAIAALLIGLAVARLPILVATIGLAVIILSVLTLIYPVVGLGVTLLFATFKPLTDYFVPELPLDIGQIALLVTLGAWFLHAVRQRRLAVPWSPLNLPLFVFVGAACLSLPGVLSAGFALQELVRWAQLVLVMWLVIDQAYPKRWQMIVGLVLGAAALQALAGVWQFGLRGDGPEHFLILGDRFYRAYGTFEQPNPYGGFIGLMLPLAIGLTLGALAAWLDPMIAAWREHQRLKWRELFITRLSHTLMVAGFILLSGLLFAALMMSWSRGAWMGFGAAVLAIVFAWPRKTWVGAAMVISAFLAALIAVQLEVLPASIAGRLTDFTEFTQTFDVRGVHISSENYAVIDRLAHWQAAQEMARYHFWTGVGLGNYQAVYPGYALMNWPNSLGHAHNIYLNFLAETGVVGLAAYLTLWTSVVWQTWRLTRQADVWIRSTAIGLLGTWTHLSVHHLVDNLYVANIHLHLGALLGVLSILMVAARRTSSGDI